MPSCSTPPTAPPRWRGASPATRVAPPASRRRSPARSPPQYSRWRLRRPVRQEYDPGAERLGLDQPQRRHVDAVGEEPLPATQDDGVDEEAVLVDEASVDQLADDGNASRD